MDVREGSCAFVNPCYTVSADDANILENPDMASPEPRREPEREWNDETQPEQGGVFIRYATINDIDEIKSRLDRQDGKIDVLSDDVTEIKISLGGLKAGQSSLESGQARLEDRQANLESGQDGLEARQAGLEARQSGLEAGLTGLESRMGRLEDEVIRLADNLNRLSDKLDKLNAHAFRILIAVIVGLILLLARDFFF